MIYLSYTRFSAVIVLSMTAIAPNITFAADTKYTAFHAGVLDCAHYLDGKDLNAFADKANAHPREVQGKGVSQNIRYLDEDGDVGFSIAVINIAKNGSQDGIHTCSGIGDSMPKWGVFKRKVLPSLKADLAKIGYVQLKYPQEGMIFSKCSMASPDAYISFGPVAEKRMSFGGQYTKRAAKFCSDYGIIK